MEQPRSLLGVGLAEGGQVGPAGPLSPLHMCHMQTRLGATQMQQEHPFPGSGRLWHPSPPEPPKPCSVFLAPFAPTEQSCAQAGTHLLHAGPMAVQHAGDLGLGSIWGPTSACPGPETLVGGTEFLQTPSSPGQAQRSRAEGVLLAQLPGSQLPVAPDPQCLVFSSDLTLPSGSPAACPGNRATAP